jgi:IS5 family transposase
LIRTAQAVRASLFAKAATTTQYGLRCATLIAASPSTKNKDKQRDPEMHQSKKGNDCTSD